MDTMQIMLTPAERLSLPPTAAGVRDRLMARLITGEAVRAKPPKPTRRRYALRLSKNAIVLIKRQAMDTHRSESDIMRELLSIPDKAAD